MFNVKRKSAPTRLPEPEKVLAVENPESQEAGQLPTAAAEDDTEPLATPPLTPLSETGDVSTDEQSVDSVEEKTVEEACRNEPSEEEPAQDEICEDEQSKNEAFDVEVCEEELSKDDDDDVEDDGSKDDDYEVEVSEGESAKDDAPQDEPLQDEAPRDEAGPVHAQDQVPQDEVPQDVAPQDEAGPAPAYVDEADPSNDPEPDPEHMFVGLAPCDMSHLAHRNGYKIYVIWFLFWIIALGGGVISYYFNAHQDIMAARLSGGIAEENLLLMPREKWDDSRDVIAKPTSYTAQRVIVMQTDTEGCDTVTTCTKLLNAMKRQEGVLKYNFLLSTDGCIYESLGWQEPSPVYPGTNTMVVAFIGDYETLAPSTMQLSQFQALLEASEELKYLKSDAKIVGRKQTVQPSKLFAYLAAFEKWDKVNSDTDDQFIDVEIEKFPIFNV